MKWGQGPTIQQSQGAKKRSSLLRRAAVTPNGYTESSNRKSRATPLPEALQKFFRPIGGDHA